MADSLPAASSRTGRWLRGLAIVWLCGIAPLAFALEVQAALPRLADHGAAAWLLAAVRSAIIVLGVTAGRLLWAGDAAGLRLATIWALASAVAAAVTAATPYFPTNRPPSEKRLVLAMVIAAHLGAAAIAAVVARRRR